MKSQFANAVKDLSLPNLESR